MQSEEKPEYLVCLLKESLNDTLSSSERPQMVPPVSKDAAEDLQKAASVLEAQALVEQKLQPADQGQVLNKVGSTFSLSFKRSSFWHQNLDT